MPALLLTCRAIHVDPKKECTSAIQALTNLTLVISDPKEAGLLKRVSLPSSLWTHKPSRAFCTEARPLLRWAEATQCCEERAVGN